VIPPVPVDAGAAGAAGRGTGAAVDRGARAAGADRGDAGGGDVGRLADLGGRRDALDAPAPGVASLNRMNVPGAEGEGRRLDQHVARPERARDLEPVRPERHR